MLPMLMEQRSEKRGENARTRKVKVRVLKEERLLRVEGKLVAMTLSEALGMTEDTVLRELAEAGKLQRVRGGALPRSAVGFVENGQVVILDDGKTALEVVRHLSLYLGPRWWRTARRPRRLSPSARP